MKKLTVIILFMTSTLCMCSKNIPGEYMGLQLKSVTRYDRNGNIIYKKAGEMFGETKFSYNSNNQCVKQENKKLKNSKTYKYHSNGKIAYSKDISNGKTVNQSWYDEHGFGIKSIGIFGETVLTKNEYDEENRLVHRIRDNGEEEWREYNSDGYTRHEKNDKGELWEQYNKYDYLIYEKKVAANGTIEERKFLYEYNVQGKVTHFKNVKEGSEYWNEYNDKGQLVYSKSTPLSFEKNNYEDDEYIEYWNELNEEGKCIHTIFSDGGEEDYLYDDNGSLIYYKRRSGDISRFIYEYYPDGKVKEKLEYR